MWFGVVAFGFECFGSVSGNSRSCDCLSCASLILPRQPLEHGVLIRQLTLSFSFQIASSARLLFSAHFGGKQLRASSFFEKFDWPSQAFERLA